MVRILAMKARIFISHSCKDFAEASEPGDEKAIARAQRLEYARWVRSAVEQRLQDSGGFEIWLDVKSFEPGDVWRAHLSRWLGSCDGAVILLNEEAAASKWVRKETTILTWRKSLRSNVRIIPALLGGFPASNLEGLGLEDVGELHTARLPSKEMTPENAQLLADKIVRKLEGLTVDEIDTPMTEWIEDVAELLHKVTDRHFKRAAERLGMDSDEGHFPDRDLTMAHYLLHASLDSAYDGLVQLKKGLDRDLFRELVGLILPIWVDPEAARNLHAIVARSRERRVLAINAKYQDTAEAYIMRALCCSLDMSQIVAATDVSGTGLAAELLPRYERAFHRKLGLGDRPTEQAVRDYLDWDKGELFILLGNGAIRADVIKALRDKYAKVTYVLLSGDDSSLVARNVPEAELIRPELAEGAEEKAATSRTRVLNLMGPR
jgi:TIR domain